MFAAPLQGSPINASSRTSRCATHDSGPVWFAIPFLLETFTLYSLPISRRTSVHKFPFLEFSPIGSPDAYFQPKRRINGLARNRIMIGRSGCGYTEKLRSDPKASATLGVRTVGRFLVAAYSIAMMPIACESRSQYTTRKLWRAWIVFLTKCERLRRI